MIMQKKKDKYFVYVVLKIVNVDVNNHFQEDTLKCKMGKKLMKDVVNVMNVKN